MSRGLSIFWNLPSALRLVRRIPIRSSGLGGVREARAAWPPSGPFRQRHGEGWAMRLPWCHAASDVLNDLIISILVAIAAVLASGLLDRVWDAL